MTIDRVHNQPLLYGRQLTFRPTGLTNHLATCCMCVLRFSAIFFCHFLRGWPLALWKAIQHFHVEHLKQDMTSIIWHNLNSSIMRVSVAQRNVYIAIAIDANRDAVGCVHILHTHAHRPAVRKADRCACIGSKGPNHACETVRVNVLSAVRLLATSLAADSLGHVDIRYRCKVAVVQDYTNEWNSRPFHPIISQVWTCVRYLKYIRK